jgi:hypothetical protein
MSWNYRVVEHDQPGSTDKSFGIHEVYYDDMGRVEAWTERAVGVTAYSVEGLAEEMEIMREALGKPVLIEKELLREIAERKSTDLSGAAE